MEEKKPKKEKKEEYIVTDEKGNIIPVEVPDEFMRVLKAMLKEEDNKNKKK